MNSDGPKNQTIGMPATRPRTNVSSLIMKISGTFFQPAPL